MANPFDQFDTPAKPSGNVFDQFDNAQGPAKAPEHHIWDDTVAGAQAIKNIYTDQITHGIFSQPVRMGMEAFDTGHVADQLRKDHPEATDDQIKSMKHNVYGNALQSARDSSRQANDAQTFPGKPVANFAVGMASDPELALIPGGKMAAAGKPLAARLAANAAAGATKWGVVSSVQDDAAQLMDIAEGQKKKYDLEQNLQQTAGGALGGALFGGVHGAAPEINQASDFVKNLFANRGKDTLPGARPDGANTPMTGNNVSMTPEQRGQLQTLLKTGSVDEIKGFLADKQGPKPTYQDVNRLVETRDAIPDTLPNAQQAFDQHIADTNHEAVQTHIGDTTSGWKNKPDIEYHRSVDDIQDPELKAQVAADAEKHGTPGGFLDANGKVHVFTDAIKSPEQANALMYHEGLGHFGLQQKFGAGLDKTIDTLLKRNVGQFGKDVDAWQKENPNTYGGNRTRAAEEVLAEMSEKGQIKPSVGDALASHVRRFGRAMGMKLSYSDAEVAHIMSMAHDAVVSGKGRNVSANGFRSPLSFSENDPGNKYMFTGPKATFHDELSPDAFMTRGGAVRNELSDHEAYLRPIKDGPQTLGEVLDHPALFEQYPELADIRVAHTEMDPGHDGAYSPKTKTIYVNKHIDDTSPRKLKTVLHETQHAIQDIEGEMKPGEGNLEASANDYRADPREMEATLTEERANYDDDTRRAAYRPKYISAARLAAMDKNYEVKSIEEAYKATDEDYVPTNESWAETKRNALEAGFSASQIKAFGKTPELAKRSARITAAAKVLDQKIAGLMDKLDTPDWSVRDMDNLRQAVADHSYVLSKLRDERAATARALNIAKLGYTRSQMQSFGELLREQGGTLAPLGDDATLLKFARQMKNVAGGKNPNGMNTLVSQLNKPNWEDYVITAHNAMMLSGLSTHVKAPQDMMMGIGRDLLHNTAALPLSAAREALRSLGVPLKPGVHPLEVEGRIGGIFKAALDADTYRNTAIALAKGNTNPSGFSQKQTARIPVVSKVMDLISAQDTFFRSFATNMHLYGEGRTMALEDYRAANGGKNPPLSEWDNVKVQGDAYARQPSAKMLAKAKAAADENLLLNKNKLTEPLDRWKATTPNSSPARRFGAFIANFLTPFVRVESNSLYNRVIRNSPLAILDPGTLRDIKAGGAKADVAMARVAFGFATFAAAWHAAGEGKITGEGPDNPSKKAVLKATGWRPAASHEDGQYNTGSQLGSSFNPLDIHNQTAMTVAALREAWEKGANKGQVATAMKFSLMSIMSHLSEMSYVSDLAPAMDALTARGATAGDKAGQFLGKEAATMSPNLTAQAARVMDQSNPQTDDSESWGNTIKNNVQATIPGLRDKLPNQVDPMGGDVQGGASFAGQHSWMPQTNRVTGGNHVDETHDPAKKEIGRLSEMYQESILTPVQKTISIEGEKRKLTPKEFETYQRMAGTEIVETLRDEMAKPEWHQMADEDKAVWIRDMQKERKAAVKEYLYGGN